MSTQEPRQTTDGDLIDFQLSSPDLPRARSSQLLTDLDDNLIDSELPLLEQKLQNSLSNRQSHPTSPVYKNESSIDVEDILIDIEDVDPPPIDITASPSSSQSTSERRNSDFLLDLDNTNEFAAPHDNSENLEALNVLLKLDEMLNDTLMHCDDYTDSDSFDFEQSNCDNEESIEDCLKDLDSYLQKFDVTDFCGPEVDDNNRESLMRTKSVLHSLAEMGVAQGVETEIYANQLNKELIEKLRDQLVSGGTINYGYEEHPGDEEGYSYYKESQRRPTSASSMRLSSSVNRSGNEAGDAFNRNRVRSTLSAVCKRHRRRLNRDALRRTVGAIRTADPSSVQSRISAPTPGVVSADSDEEIDWSWLQDVARDINRERLAHAAGECYTSSVVVEPVHRSFSGNHCSIDVETDVEELGVPDGGGGTNSIVEVSDVQIQQLEQAVTTMPESMVGTDPKEDRRVGNSWLRSSMRRLRPFRLPSDASPPENFPTGQQTFNGNSEIQPPELQTVTVVGQSVSAASESQVNGAMTAVVRPFSAPSRIPTQPSTSRARSRSRDSRVNGVPAGRARSSSASSRSRRPRSLSSSVSSLASSVDSSPSSIPTPTPVHGVNPESSSNTGSNSRRSCERGRTNEIPEAESPLGQWPHSLSSMLACLGCTLGLFNISRFAILSVHFGANFIFQFFILSLLIGLPLFTLQLCLGQQLGAGVIDMWRISPLFQGVGISLLVAQAMIGLYSITGVSWMFVYFRDSFITKMDRYRWAEPFVYYRNDITPPVNGSYKLSETVPDYLSGVVLQRHNLASGNALSTIKFQPAFNLAVIWMIIFVSLSKGLRSYGKVIYVFTLIPVFGTFVLCAKVLGMMPPEFIHVVFPETSWSEFFLNSKSWLAASQEVFLTWGLLGAAAMQIASHNKNKQLLRRDSTLIAVITFTILLLVAFLANTCIQILRSYGYSYQPNSFEKITTYGFMRSVKDPLPPSLASTPVRYMIHNSFIVGERVTRSGTDYSQESGYQVLRLATELVPAMFALLGPEQISPFWAVLFYFILILFGIAQQLAIWHCLITGIMAIKAKVLKSWETTITFFSCACGFVLGLPMTTEFGIFVVYFLDLTVGGTWWLILVILLQIVAVFMVRGRPYSGDTVVTALFKSTNPTYLVSWAPALLSFTWNVVLPVGLTILCITTFKNGNFRELFVWHHAPSLEYWPLWARQLGSMIQLLPVLCIPLVAVIQSYRYLNSGPPDILDRIQLLYRPPIGEHMEDLAIQEAATASMNNNTTTAAANVQQEDPPPKYTPPPSYTTATGARLAKMLRQSIRRSMRRIANALGETSNSRQRNNPQGSQENQPPPPDYNTVLVEMNQTLQTNNQDQLNITITDGSENTSNNQSTLQRHLASLAGTSGCLTAADVACILRNSFRRSTNTIRRNVTIPNDNSINSLSAENLVDNVAPIGETSLVLDHLSGSENERDLKPHNDDNLASVI